MSITTTLSFPNLVPMLTAVFNKHTANVHCANYGMPNAIGKVASVVYPKRNIGCLINIGCMFNRWPNLELTGCVTLHKGLTIRWSRGKNAITPITGCDDLAALELIAREQAADTREKLFMLAVAVIGIVAAVITVLEGLV